eukprot:m.1200352 g.1200352  ORF g.1200352 m.1200352 type:complete len:252 (-) comp24573_c0_seq1:3706-4461(-)
MPFPTSERFRTTTAESYRSFNRSTERRTSISHDSNANNNPQSSRHFRFTKLPSGEKISIPAVDGIDGYSTRRLSVAGTEVPKTGDTTQRTVFQGQQWDPWQRGNTARYGNREELWVNKARAATGIAPVIHQKDMNSMRTTMTANQETYRSQSFDLGRNPHSMGERTYADIQQVVGEASSEYVVDWLKSASPENAAVVMMFLEDMGTKMRNDDPETSKHDDSIKHEGHAAVILPEIERIFTPRVPGTRIAQV